MWRRLISIRFPVVFCCMAVVAALIAPQAVPVAAAQNIPSMDDLYKAARAEGQVVFGGAIKLPGNTSYVDYLMPGIFVQTVVFGSLAAAIGLATYLKSGLLERFRSLPMARSAVLTGRTLADLVPRYLDLLTAGGSDAPHVLLARLGVDVNDPGFWELGLRLLGDMVDEAEELARRV